MLGSVLICVWWLVDQHIMACSYVGPNDTWNNIDHGLVGNVFKKDVVVSEILDLKMKYKWNIGHKTFYLIVFTLLIKYSPFTFLDLREKSFITTRGLCSTLSLQMSKNCCLKNYVRYAIGVSVTALLKTHLHSSKISSSTNFLITIYPFFS